MKLQEFDWRYFHGQSHCKDYGPQNYLLFQPVYRFFKKIANRDYISSWEAKVLKLFLHLTVFLLKRQIILTLWVKDDESCLKQDKVIFPNKAVINFDSVYKKVFGDNIDKNSDSL